MNGLLSNLVANGGLFSKAGSQVSVDFAYMEMLGDDIADCLAPTGTADKDKVVKIGEALDGRILTRNLSKHRANTEGELTALIAKAHSLRSTAATVSGEGASE